MALRWVCFVRLTSSQQKRICNLGSDWVLVHSYLPKYVSLNTYNRRNRGRKGWWNYHTLEINIWQLHTWLIFWVSRQTIWVIHIIYVCIDIISSRTGQLYFCCHTSTASNKPEQAVLRMVKVELHASNFLHAQLAISLLWELRSFCPIQMLIDIWLVAMRHWADYILHWMVLESAKA